MHCFVILADRPDLTLGQAQGSRLRRSKRSSNVLAEFSDARRAYELNESGISLSRALPHTFTRLSQATFVAWR
jgi:hypothetical protein